MASPRLFKSHEAYDTVAKGGRYIHGARDPKDAFVPFHTLPQPAPAGFGFECWEGAWGIGLFAAGRSGSAAPAALLLWAER